MLYPVRQPLRLSVERRPPWPRGSVPHPDVFDPDRPAPIDPDSRPYDIHRMDAAVDFVELTPLVERMRVAFFFDMS